VSENEILYTTQRVMFGALGVASLAFAGRVAYLTIQSSRMRASGIGATGKALSYIRRFKGLS
jgi:hypothetical protein